MSAQARIEGFCPNYCPHGPCLHSAAQSTACGTCGGTLSGSSAPFPRCVPCGQWEDECSCAEAWRYEPEEHSGADVFHHIVCGDRHIAEVGTEADARLIVEAVNATRLSPPSNGGAA